VELEEAQILRLVLAAGVQAAALAVVAVVVVKALLVEWAARAAMALSSFPAGNL
jgi:hypothetical protein